MTEQAMAVVAAYVRSYPAEAAHVLERRPLDELADFLGAATGDAVAELLDRMEINTAARGLERVDPPRAAAILAGLRPARAVALARGMRAEARRLALRLLPPPRQRDIEQLLSLREHTVGSRMESRIRTLPPETTAAEAIALVRDDSQHVSQYLYVVDRDRQLRGVVSLKELLAATDAARVDTLMTRRVIALRVRDSLPSAQTHPAWTRYRMLPVVDERGHFAGVLRHPGPSAGAADEHPYATPAEQASAALGDLYRIGLTALFNSTMRGAASAPSGGRAAPAGGAAAGTESSDA